VSESDPGKTFEISLAKGRQAYLLCIEGSLNINGTGLAARDAAELRAPSRNMPMSLHVGESGGHFMLIEMKHEP
jgi:quercetin 2,3-dioxygenase